MDAFTLDTSGAVHVGYVERPDGPYLGAVMWSDLSPFAQGYVEALFASGIENKGPGGLLRNLTVNANLCGFSDLAPETLAAILKDCEALAKHGATDDYSGGQFWRDRQTGAYPISFPPLTPYLDDTGKVRLREAGQ